METGTTDYAVGRVAELAGVTVRTLHHYDRIGLLRPSGRSEAGYRRYDDADLQRLQQILLYRELGFPLEQIAAILAEPEAGLEDHLRRQHRMLLERMARLQRMVATIERELEATKMGYNLTPEERLEVFGDFDPDAHAEEAEQRWGHTDAYKESQRRAKSYDKSQWQQIGAESGAIEQGLKAALEAGTPADSDEAMDLAERHRQHISRWFYDCSYEIHRGLGEMYVADERFKAHYEQIAPGLAEYARDAIRANAGRAAKG
jgi:DNA-binding transcriptional MerR regulator